MNKSSSFYSEEYFQKLRKTSHIRKPIYRERHKELYDQQHELQILRYYKNVSGRCEMMEYFRQLNEVYMEMKQKNIRNNEDYTKGVEQFIKDMKNRISYFHEHLMCKEYITREQYLALNLHSAQDTKQFWKRQDLLKQEKTEGLKSDQCENSSKTTVQTCNLCPIYIQEFEFNFDKSLNMVVRNCEYWQQLNGHQKINKYRSHLEQNLKVLHHELEKKCEFSNSLGQFYKMRRPRPRRRKPVI